MTATKYQNLPDAATVAQTLGAVKRGANDWRLADCGCSGQPIARQPGVNPALSLSDGPAGLRVYCHKCGNPAVDAVATAVGIERSAPTPTPAHGDGWRVVGTYIRASTSKPRNVYRRDTPTGKEIRQDRHGEDGRVSTAIVDAAEPGGGHSSCVGGRRKKRGRR